MTNTYLPSLQLKHTGIMDLEESQYTIFVLVGNYGLLTASVRAPQATVSLRLVFNAILIFSVRVHICFNDNFTTVTMIIILLL
jgi:hypothetical protein